MCSLDPLLRAHCATLPSLPPPRYATDYVAIRDCKTREGLRALHSDPSLPLPAFSAQPEHWEAVFPLQTPRAWQPDTLGQISPDDDLPIADWQTLKTPRHVLLANPRPLEELLQLTVSAYQAAGGAFARLLGYHDAASFDALTPALAAQLLASVDSANHLGSRVIGPMQKEIKLGRDQRVTFEVAQAERAAQLEDRIVVLGERTRPRYYFLIGSTRDGTLIAVSAETAQISLIIGAPHSGKTHLCRVAAESLTQHLPGLSTLTQPQRAIQSEVEFGRSRGRRQCLSGFRLNENEEQRRVLREVYGYYASGNEAYRRSTLMVLPEHVEATKKDLAPEVERGLVIRPAVLHPRELGVSGYQALLSNGRDAAGRSATESHLAGLIASKGPDALPQDILSGIDVLDPRVRPGLAQRLKLMEPLVQHGPWMSDCLQNPGPVFMILESTTMPQDLLLPFQAVSMASLGRPLSDGSDPYRWLFVDERAKLAHNAIIAQTDRTQSREHRHGRTAVCANAQEVSSFDEAFISNATIVAIGKMNNQNEIKLAQTYYGPLRDVSMNQFMSLENGEFIIAAPNNTGKHQVYRVKIRPTVLHAGGETLRL